MTRPIRSALYMPASNARAIAKARTLPCDAVILDLEDAVAPEMKAQARQMAADAVREGGFGDRVLAIRVNALDTEWGRKDCATIAAAAPDAILLPKVSAPDDLARARAAIGVDGPALWAMIETCAAILALPAIVGAAAAHRLEALVVGPNDLAKDMRCTPGADRAPLVPMLAQIIVAARAHGLIALDGVLNAIDDAERLATECAHGARLGFDGKTLIHPAQIDAANQAFAPSAARIGWARAVVAAFADPAAHEKGAIRVEGEMVERLHLAEAKALLANLQLRQPLAIDDLAPVGVRHLAGHRATRRARSRSEYGCADRRMAMPRGDKSSYTDKQKRKAAHIEQSYEARGLPEEEAERRAWATVNKDSGGGNKSGSGRGTPDINAAARRGGRTHRAGSPEARSAAARKGWETRRRNQAAGDGKQPCRVRRSSGGPSARPKSGSALPSPYRASTD